MNTFKETFAELRRSNAKWISILFIAGLPVVIFLEVSPGYLYSGKELARHIFAINYGFTFAFGFIFVLIPLIAFSDVYYFTLAIDFSRLKTKFRHSPLKAWYVVSIFSSLYAILVLLAIYFLIPLFVPFGCVRIPFNVRFPYPFISFILLPVLYFLVAFAATGIILVFASSPYVYYILLAVSLVLNVILIGMFRTILPGKTMYELIFGFIIVFFVFDILLKFKISGNKKLIS